MFRAQVPGDLRWRALSFAFAAHAFALGGVKVSAAVYAVYEWRSRAARAGLLPADVAAAIDWSEAAAGPSADGDVDVDIEQPAADPELRQRV